MTKPRVLQVGMDPRVIDFSPWPGQDADALLARIGDAEAALRRAGFDDSPETTVDAVRRGLSS